MVAVSEQFVFRPEQLEQESGTSWSVAAVPDTKFGSFSPDFHTQIPRFFVLFNYTAEQ